MLERENKIIPTLKKNIEQYKDEKVGGIVWKTTKIRVRE